MQNLKNSQNFLVDKELVRNLVAKSKLNKKDTVIEIGPGKGIITNILGQYAGNVLAIEYDASLYRHLVENNRFENVEYVFGDILKYDLPANHSYKVFSNIPFQITADIIKKLTEDVNPPSEIFLVVQKEAAKKYCGIPFQKYEGMRAAIVKAQYQVDIIHNFRRSDFSPSPSVETVLIHFKRKKTQLNLSEYKDFKDFVAFFYSHGKGENTRDRLAVVFSNAQIRKLCKDNNINILKPYTFITSEQWIKIFVYSRIGLTEEKKKLIKGSYKKMEKVNKGLHKQNKTNLRNAPVDSKKVAPERRKKPRSH